MRGARPAGRVMRSFRSNRAGSTWCYAPLEEVQRNLSSTGYPTSTHFVRGPVEETIRKRFPARSPCCASIPTGMSPQGTSSSI